jgi:hypothetical protein
MCERFDAEMAAGGLHLPEAQKAFDRCVAALTHFLPEDSWEMGREGWQFVSHEDNSIVDYWIFKVRVSFLGNVWMVVGGALPPTMVQYQRKDIPQDVVLAAIEGRSGYFTEMYGAAWYADFNRPFLWDLDWCTDLGIVVGDNL